MEYNYNRYILKRLLDRVLRNGMPLIIMKKVSH